MRQGLNHRNLWQLLCWVEFKLQRKGPGLLYQSIINTAFQGSYRERCEKKVLGEQPAIALIFIPSALRSDRTHPTHKKYLSTKPPMHAAKTINESAFLMLVLAKRLKYRLTAIVRKHAPLGAKRMNCHILTIHARNILHEIWEISRENEYLRDREKRCLLSYCMLFYYWKNVELSLAYYLQMKEDKENINFKEGKNFSLIRFFLLSCLVQPSA